MCNMTEKLIEIVKNYPLLFDPDSKDKDKKYELWRQVAKEAGLGSGKIAKAKWRNIRDSYVKHIKAHIDPENLATKKYFKWPWASRLKFLNHHLCLGNKSVTDFQNYCESESNFPDLGETSDDNNKEFQIDHVEFNEDSSNPADLCMNGIKQEMTEPPHMTSFGRHFHNVPQDPIDLLFMSYAETVKKFSPKRQVEAKMHLAAIINKLESEQIVENEERS